MLSPEESKKLDQILRSVQETSDLVHEIRLWRKFIAWAFALVTGLVTIWDLWNHLRGK